MKKHDEFETKFLMVPRVNNVAFKRAMRTYIIKPIESNKFNYEQFITDIVYNANIALSTEIRIRLGSNLHY